MRGVCKIMGFLFKAVWIFRAIFYKCIFAKLLMPSYIGPPVFLLNTRRRHFGKRVRIFPGLRAECHGKGKIFVQDNVSIGQGFHVIASSELYIGRGCLISGNVFVTDTEHSFDQVDIPVFDQSDKVIPTRIGENCFIGMGARIQAGTILGKGCVVGANSVVRGEFPDYCVIVGAPGRIVKRYDSEACQWVRC